MDKWSRTALGDVLKIEHGFAFKGKYFDPAGSRILLTPKNFKASGGLDLAESRCRFYEGPVERRFVLDSGDIVVAMTDLKQDAPILGSAGTVPDGERYLHNQRIGKVKIRDEDRLDRRFAPWLLNSPVVREAVRSSATGSTVRHTAPTRIEAVTVPLPPVHTQRRIAATLSAFDELVAGNKRRIQLLEDLARSLYREWFVHFRYPGHTPGLDAAAAPVPEGWEVHALGELIEINRDTIKASELPDPVDYLDISSVGNGNLKASRPMGAAEAPSRARRRVADGDVVWSTVRPNRRAHCVIHDPAPNLIASTGLAVLSPVGVPSSFLFEYASSEVFSSYLVGRATGSAYPAVRPKDFAAAPVILPPKEFLDRFDSVVDPMLRLRTALQRQSTELGFTRDLLLPRLVTGQLDISDIDLGVLTPSDPE